jgi:hypothetical protein
VGGVVGDDVVVSPRRGERRRMVRTERVCPRFARVLTSDGEDGLGARSRRESAGWLAGARSLGNAERRGGVDRVHRATYPALSILFFFDFFFLKGNGPEGPRSFD